MTRLLTRLAGRILSRKAHGDRRKIRANVNAMRKHFGMKGRV